MIKITNEGRATGLNVTFLVEMLLFGRNVTFLDEMLLFWTKCYFFG